MYFPCAPSWGVMNCNSSSFNLSAKLQGHSFAKQVQQHHSTTQHTHSKCFTLVQKYASYPLSSLSQRGSDLQLHLQTVGWECLKTKTYIYEVHKLKFLEQSFGVLAEKCHLFMNSTCLILSFMNPSVSYYFPFNFPLLQAIFQVSHLFLHSSCLPFHWFHLPAFYHRLRHWYERCVFFLCLLCNHSFSATNHHTPVHYHTMQHSYDKCLDLYFGNI